MKGYKVFSPDWKCRDFQYKAGEIFRFDGEIKLCGAGFHFCEKLADCFSYYDFDIKNKVAEIEALGNVKTYGDKCVTDKIKIVREITWHEVLELVNTGKNCTGFKNSGDYNSGNYNSGNFNSGICNSGNHNSGEYNSGDGNSGFKNSGDCNSGHCNSGYRNSGFKNSGDCNSGHCNSGDCNSGHCNSGDFNSGCWNSCDFSTGFFNSVSPPLYAFNKTLKISRGEFLSCAGVKILSRKFRNNIWIPDYDMTVEEKENHPEYRATGGYLKTLDFKTACQIMWENLDKKERISVCEIPNFDPEIFHEITGISIREV